MAGLMPKTKLLLFLLIAILIAFESFEAQEKESSEITSIITKFKKDARGPYKAIRWFCPDGSTVAPDQRCPEPGGVQRAQYKDEVIKLAVEKHIFIGQILAATSFEEFWDEQNNNSRLKQYQIEKYLREIDNGWVLRKAQYYRGAFQAEDEAAWAKKFFEQLLIDDEILKSKFMLIRESIKDIPHAGDDNKAQSIRIVSKNISDTLKSFMDLRVKIHGQPETADIIKVKDFRKKNQSSITPSLNNQFNKLINDMEDFFKPADLSSLSKYLKRLPSESKIRTAVENFISDYSSVEQTTKKKMLIDISDLLLNIRKELSELPEAEARLTAFDLSVKLESILFKELSGWETKTVSELIEKNYHLAKAATGCGYLELWEWDRVSGRIALPAGDEISIQRLNDLNDNFKRVVEWSTSMFRAYYETAVDIYSSFEPLSEGFFDNKVRASLLLPLGSTVSRFGDYISEKVKNKNFIIGLQGAQQARGLNPGFAQGVLVVVTGSAEDINFTSDKIYVFNKPPADMKPVAGIATVSEGNLVSHVQLLARNLGIPNAVVTHELLNSLKEYDGQKVFYAVSRKGTVIIKKSSEMNNEEKKLFEKKNRSEETVTVPTDKLKLDVKNVLNLRNLKADDSGVLCGPKAANLGQLKYMFPDKVVEGLVIPFGIFRDHMDQKIPGKEISYWQFMNKAFEKREEMIKAGGKPEAIENYIFTELTTLRKEISKMNLKEEFVDEIREAFKSVLGNDLGKIAVFIRSDTNMEDLKDFTGAGLNLTVFNVLEDKKILNAIKEVWASPYTERSFRWRQKFLNNPENVFPSILIIPTVDVDISGVMITAGVTSGDPEDLTIAFSKGAGGAVEGQLAETYLINNKMESTLLSPAREMLYTKLPQTGGTAKASASFNNPLLSQSNIEACYKLSKEIKTKLPGSPGIESAGPYDVELGFKDNKLWLFQVRPFVESKRAVSSGYLLSLDPAPNNNIIMKLNEKL